MRVRQTCCCGATIELDHHISTLSIRSREVEEQRANAAATKFLDRWVKQHRDCAPALARAVSTTEETG